MIGQKIIFKACTLSFSNRFYKFGHEKRTCGHESTVYGLFNGMFGIFKLSIIISGLIFIINSLDSSQNIFKKDIRERSYLYSPIEKVAPICFPSIKELFKENPVEKIKQEISDES